MYQPLIRYLLLFGLCGALSVAAQGLFGDDDDGFTLEEPGSIVKDFAQLKHSYLTELDGWEGVAPASGGEEGVEYGWKSVSEPGYNHLRSFVGRVRMTVQPLKDAPLTSRIDVPEAGQYRIWLCYLARPGPGHPLHLSIGDQTLQYYTEGLSGNDTGASQEGQRPIRFESDIDRIGMTRQPTFNWEYRDVTLAAGRQAVSLRTAPGDVRVDSLMVTRSRDFRPSKAIPLDANTLGRSWLRFRVVEGTKAASVSFSNDLTYHSPHFLHGDDTRNWYWAIERELGLSPRFGDENNQPVAPGVWSRWLDGSASLLSRGNFVSGYITILGAQGPLTLETQLAWYPHEGAVTRTLAVPVAANHSRATILLPLYEPRIPFVRLKPDDDEQVAWGMRAPAYLARLQNTLDVVEVQQRVLAEVELPDAPPTQALRVTTSCNPDPVARQATAAMLRTMGFSHATGLDKQSLAANGMREEVFTHHNDLLFHTNTHCPSDPLARRNLQRHFERTRDGLVKAGWEPEEVTLAKLGDEIGAIVSTHHINHCTDCLARFHAYLGEHYGEPDFFGVQDWDDLRVDGASGGIYQRRLKYASGRFIMDFTAEFYKLATEVIEELMPNCRTFCNFSPHPVIFGGTMNYSDWFNLTRRGGTSLAWGEDWASMSSWGFYMGWQIVSYYASLVEAAARTVDGRAGFYAVWGTGRQQASCVTRGINTVVVYSYGPEYALADAANAWSDRYARYGPIAQGLRVLGGADAYLAEGSREAAPVAIYYNRDHEVWNESLGQFMQSERASLLVGLSQANIPTTIAIEEDILDGPPAEWQAIIVTGFNLGDEVIAALEAYASRGGTVVFTGGAGLYDRFDSASTVAPALQGVRQQLAGFSTGSYAPAGLEQHEAIDTVTFPDGGEWPVIGLKVALEPLPETPVTTLASFSDGSPALVRRDLGDGAVYTWAISPGVVFRGMSPMRNADGKLTYGQYKREDAARLALPLGELGSTRTHRYAHHLVETRQFDRPEGSAVLLINFAYEPLAAGELRLRWPADRPLTSIRSVHAGQLDAVRDGDWVVVQVPLAHETDAVIFEE